MGDKTRPAILTVSLVTKQNCGNFLGYVEIIMCSHSDMVVLFRQYTVPLLHACVYMYRDKYRCVMGCFLYMDNKRPCTK